MWLAYIVDKYSNGTLGMEARVEVWQDDLLPFPAIEAMGYCYV
jgi:hypothetical protein